MRPYSNYRAHYQIPPFDAPLRSASSVGMTESSGCLEWKKGAPTHIKFNKVSARPFSHLLPQIKVIPTTGIAPVKSWHSNQKCLRNGGRRNLIASKLLILTIIL